MAARKKTAKKRSVKKTARKKVPPIPKGAHTVTAYLAIKNCTAALAFYAKAFGAKETMRLTDANGRIGHAEMRIGNSAVMLADEFPEMGILGPQTRSPVTLHLAVKNVDEAFARAVAAGAKAERPVTDQFYGHRSGMLMDPFGYSWNVSSQVEVLSVRTMQKRWDELQAKMSKPG